MEKINQHTEMSERMGIIYKPNEREMKGLATFLATLNRAKQSHIGFCGDVPDEIGQALYEDFMEDNGELSFMVAKNESDEFIAAIGLDMEEDTAEVWGPFQSTEDNDTVMTLWDRLCAEYPSIQTFLFFIHEENMRQAIFAESIGATPTGKHSMLKVKKGHIKPVGNKQSIPFEFEDFPAFQVLHDTTFPGTYYDAATIVDRLDDGHTLNVLKTSDGHLIGYVYYEIDTQFQEGSIEYIAINPMFRGKGWGAALLSETVAEMFAQSDIPEISLVVSHKDKAARLLYLKSGFTEVDVLHSYTYTAET